MDLIERMKDLLKQAETEESHFYVASVLKEAIEEIGLLRIMIARYWARNKGKDGP